MRLPFRPRRRLLIGSCVAGILLPHANGTIAAEWKGQLGLGAQQTYSSNISLRPSGLEDPDWLTTITPSITVTGVGGRMRALLNYTPQLLYYARDGQGDVNNLLNAAGTVELIEDRGFIDATASISRQNITLRGSQGAANNNLTANSSEVRSLTVSPFLRGPISTYADYELRYRYSIVTSDSALANSGISQIDARINGGKHAPEFRWFVSYSDVQQSNEGAVRDTGFRNFVANFNWQAFKYFGIVGGALNQRNDVVSRTVERNFNSANLGVSWQPTPYFYADARYNDSNTGSFASGNVRWRPTERTNFAAGTTVQSFGRSYYLNFDHRTRLSVWSAQYAETLSTTQGQLSSGLPFGATSVTPAAVTPPPPPPTGTVASQFDATNFFANQEFLEKRFRLTSAYNGPRAAAALGLFSVKRSAVSIGARLPFSDFAISNDIDQTGGDLSAGLTLDARTRLNASVAYSVVDYVNSPREDKDLTIQANINRQFQPNVAGQVQLRRTQRDTNAPGQGYTENAAIASVGVRF